MPVFSVCSCLSHLLSGCHVSPCMLHSFCTRLFLLPDSSVRVRTVSNASATCNTQHSAGCRVGVQGCSPRALWYHCWLRLNAALPLARFPPVGQGGSVVYWATLASTAQWWGMIHSTSASTASYGWNPGKVMESLRAPSVTGDNNSNYLTGWLWGLKHLRQCLAHGKGCLSASCYHTDTGLNSGCGPGHLVSPYTGSLFHNMSFYALPEWRDTVDIEAFHSFFKKKNKYRC